MIRKFKSIIFLRQSSSKNVGCREIADFYGSGEFRIRTNEFEKKTTTTCTGNQNETYCGESSPYFDVLAFGCTCM